MVTKRKAAPKRPAPDPRYVLGQLCYRDGTGYARCRVCQSGDQITPTGRTYIPHAPACVIGQAIAVLREAMDAAPPLCAVDIERALTLLGG